MTVDNCPELVKKGIQHGNFVSLRECMKFSLEQKDQSRFVLMSSSHRI